MEQNKKKLKLFSVVLFEVGKKYAVVPSTWISEEHDSCQWPDSLTKKPESLMKDAKSTPGPKWKSFRIHLVKSYDSFERATKKSETLRSSATLDLESSGTECPAVKTNKPSTSGVVVDIPTTFPGLHQEEQVEDDVLKGITTADNQEVVPGPTYTGVDENGESQVEFTINATDTSEGVVGNYIEIHNPGLESLRLEFERFQEITLRNQETLLQEVRDLKGLLRQVLATGSGEQHTHTYSPLPLKTVEELNEAESKITNDRHQFNYLVDELKRIGGPSVRKTIYNCLRQYLTKDLAKTIRFSAASGKIPFGALKLAEALRVAVQSIWGHKAASDTVINDTIGKYFRNTVERNKNNGNLKKDSNASNTAQSEEQLETNSDEIC